MRTSDASRLFTIRIGSARKHSAELVWALMLVLALGVPVHGQSVVANAESMDGKYVASAGEGVSGTELISVLEAAAATGQPMALWQLGEMYENGVGVEQDKVRAFGYFSKIANENASAPPHSVEADIVARSFIKVGEYYKAGLPDAGIAPNQARARALLIHAASYFADADAQYRVGLMYLKGEEVAPNALLSKRWLSLAAHKGHVSAQAVLGDLLFNGYEGEDVSFGPQSVEGLMWLILAYEGTFGSEDEVWIGELLNRAMSIATPEQRMEANSAADSVRSRIARN
ncbi:MAG TPA: sel1 repeat family protein [Devosia sp.]|nr:sel1 repeat family protein [Devosia sp.]